MPARKKTASALVAVAMSLLTTPVFAADSAVQKVGFAPRASERPALLAPAAPAGPAAAYVFSAPPRESATTANEIYGPIAEYLSRITGKPVTFRRAPNWIAYQTEMRRGDYDLIFDGPHFNGWRASHLQHNILAKAPGDHSFVVAVREGSRVADLRQLAGRPLCGMSPPNLGTLTVLGQFDNPMRQPVIRNTLGWNQIYNDMLTGKCTAAILPTRNLAKYDPTGVNSRVIYKARSFPSQALSAGPRVSAADQARIAAALTSIDARPATLRLRDAYALNGDLLPANKDEYLGVARILKDTWGYQ